MLAPMSAQAGHVCEGQIANRGGFVPLGILDKFHPFLKLFMRGYKGTKPSLRVDLIDARVQLKRALGNLWAMLLTEVDEQKLQLAF